MKASSKAAGKVIRILLADDHSVVREGMVSILKAKDIKVIGEASDGEEACRLYDQLSPDILILDLRTPKKDGFIPSAISP
jgi:YesN/AraC family two-component response regulator